MTFKEFWNNSEFPDKSSHYDSMKAAWDAKQAEIDQLKDAYSSMDEYLMEIGELDNFIRWTEKNNKIV